MTESSQQPGASVDAPGGFQLRLVPSESTPLYLQIVHQLRYLIITHRLGDGARLPAVRTVAASLGINPGTVVQAYRELAASGLVESVRGRGTVVRRLSAAADETATRAGLLEQAATAMVRRARALGCTPDEIRQQVNTALLLNPTIPVLFVGINADQARRYVAEELGPRYADRGVEFRAFGVEDVLKATPELLRELELAHTVVAFVTSAPEIERTLAEHGIDADIVGVTAELTATTVERLRHLDPRGRHTLVTEQHTITPALADVTGESGLDVADIEVIAARPDGSIDADELAALAASDRVVIYSFGVAAAIDALRLPDERLLPLRFTLSPSALARLDARWSTP